MKVLEKDKAIELRKQGKTYTEIQKRIPISKSCLSYWLRDIKLNREQLKKYIKKISKLDENLLSITNLKEKKLLPERIIFLD
jgi:transposase